MKEIKSREGYYLTQSADIANEDRMYITAIKGMNVNETDWREATQEEKDAFEKAQEEKMKQEELLYIGEGRIYLTEQGMDLSNYVISQFLL
jgi:oxygen-independent coproporphyrinogen-3 oxidase